ncbi:ankyrin repeat-containing domain protein [Russula vinacea]|nr:ankyrin repeat-containing domain protein [Russula vinacea]
MADYDIFREQLAIKYPSYGHALWEPSPRRPDRPVQVGDVGFIRRGKFTVFSTPCFQQMIHPTSSACQNIMNLLSPPCRIISTRALWVAIITVLPGLAWILTQAIIPADVVPAQMTFRKSRFSIKGQEGCSIISPVAARREDTLAQGDFRRWMVKHIDSDVILVTGCDHTRSWTNVAFLGSEGDAQASFGVRSKALVPVSISNSHLNAPGGRVASRPEGTNLPENQCVFIRGLRVARSFWILPRRLMAAAGPSSDMGGYDYDPDTEVISIPAVTKYRDPLHLLQEYIAEEASDCDMVITHDDDLVTIDGLGHDASLETLEPDVVMDLLRRSNIEIHKASCDLSPTDGGPNTDTPVVKVAMLSMTSQNWNTATPTHRHRPSPRKALISATQRMGGTSISSVPTIRGDTNNATRRPPYQQTMASYDTDLQGDFPLHKAVRSQKLDIVESLLKGGADVNVQSKYNPTPLHEAAGSGYLDITQLLLSHGRLSVAQGSTITKLDIVEILLKGGANVNAQSKYNLTPFHEAAGSGNLDITQLLLSHGADINTIDLQGDSPLHKAVRSQKLDIVEILLKGGADVNVQSKYKPTLLHEAAGSGNLEITQLLLSHGANINTVDLQGDSPLHKAVRSQKLGIVEILLKGGANVNVQSKYNPTPLHEAAGSGNLEIAQLLLSHGAD